MADDEVLGLFDPDGVECGRAPRSRVRARNLRHAATAILVYDGAGHIYVHRRTESKDIYPGLWDFCCGGALRAGEDPADGAAREAAEELGVRGVPLLPAGRIYYADSAARFFCHRFACRYDGPIVWQPEEVAEGNWWTVPGLRAALAARPEDFVPDSPRIAGDLLPRDAGFG
jgi:8-oxo-dGTP pyrophosphatase MutT (NUDIX family)